jgi:hypothetical protein
MTDLLTTEDTLLLDQMLAHEAKCEADHNVATTPICSSRPTHHYTVPCVAVDKLICASAVKYVHAAMVARGGYCKDCRQPVRDCWTVTPA